LCNVPKTKIKQRNTAASSNKNKNLRLWMEKSLWIIDFFRYASRKAMKTLQK